MFATRCPQKSCLRKIVLLCFPTFWAKHFCVGPSSYFCVGPSSYFCVGLSSYFCVGPSSYFCVGPSSYFFTVKQRLLTQFSYKQMTI